MQNIGEVKFGRMRGLFFTLPTNREHIHPFGTYATPPSNMGTNFSALGDVITKLNRPPSAHSRPAERGSISTL